ncbi:MAG: FHA domain-containing protein, partial [Acaryochloridaceae cyanobacterium RL_2_7]|nr:FHA domain-containing protein [Acaryochloridaceae cyanobacterium RL_2_7]
MGDCVMRFEHSSNESQANELESPLSSLPGTIMASGGLSPMLLQVITPDWSLDFPLERPEMSLGSSPQNDCVVDAEGIAPEHLKIIRVGESYEVKDLTGKAQLFYQNIPVSSHFLKDGDRLSLGSRVTLIYQVVHDFQPVKQVETLMLREKDSLTIGRDPRNQTVLDHPLVSRFHARMQLKQGQWQVEDLNSSNGTFVNNQLIAQSQRLSPGDAIRIGPYQFSFNFDETLIQQNDTGNLRLDAIHLSTAVTNLTILNDISLS